MAYKSVFSSWGLTLSAKEMVSLAKAWDDADWEEFEAEATDCNFHRLPSLLSWALDDERYVAEMEEYISG